MQCEYCKAEYTPGQEYCGQCGAKLPQPAQQPQYQQPQYQQPQYQTPYQAQPQYQPPYQPLNQQAELPMKWFKFLIYFSLFAGAVLNLITGINVISGGHYGDTSADLIYRYFPDLKSTDMIHGLGCIALAVLGVVARFALAKYKANGPKLLTILYIVSSVVQILYMIMASSAVGDVVDLGSSYSSTIGSVIGNVVMIFVNNTYFKKRAHLFVN